MFMKNNTRTLAPKSEGHSILDHHHTNNVGVFFLNPNNLLKCFIARWSTAVGATPPTSTCPHNSIPYVRTDMTRARYNRNSQARGRKDTARTPLTNA